MNEHEETLAQALLSLDAGLAKEILNQSWEEATPETEKGLLTLAEDAEEMKVLVETDNYRLVEDSEGYVVTVCGDVARMSQLKEVHLASGKDWDASVWGDRLWIEWRGGEEDSFPIG